jgi:hypothetical protein
MTQHPIAGAAQQPAYSPGLVVVVDVHVLLRDSETDEAAPSLTNDHLAVVVKR